MEYSKAYRHLVLGAYDILFVMSPIPYLGCICVGLLLRPRAVGWVYTFLVRLCCCDVVCCLQTIPEIVEAEQCSVILNKSACIIAGVHCILIGSLERS
jgi:hypothetical protein